MVLRDPAWCFLVVAAGVGVALAFVTPAFDGVDESAHFARAYQVSDGRIIPEEVDGAEGGGACLPVDVIIDVRVAVLANLTGRVVGAENGESVDATRDDLRREIEALPMCGDPDERLADVTSFAWYSPVGYAPQAVGIAVARSVGAGTNTMLVAGRLAGVAAYIGLAFVAIRRAPRGQWALHIAAIVPMALLTASGITPDAITAGMALLLVSSALRLGTRARITGRAVWLDAVPVALLLGLGKPTYWIVGLCFLLPLVAGSRPPGAMLMVIPVAAGALASAVWQRATADLFVCDVRFFGSTTAPGDQARSLVTSPHTFLAEAFEVTADDGWRWVRELVATYARVFGKVPLVVVLFGLALLVAIAAQRGGDEPTFYWRERTLLVTVAILGLLAVLAGFYVYCSPRGELAAPFTGARHFLPLLPVLLVGVGPPYRRWTGVVTRVPLTLVELPAGVAIVLAVAAHA